MLPLEIRQLLAITKRGKIILSVRKAKNDSIVLEISDAGNDAKAIPCSKNAGYLNR